MSVKTAQLPISQLNHHVNSNSISFIRKNLSNLPLFPLRLFSGDKSVQMKTLYYFLFRKEPFIKAFLYINKRGLCLRVAETRTKGSTINIAAHAA
jgi:hypothetical protein